MRTASLPLVSQEPHPRLRAARRSAGARLLALARLVGAALALIGVALSPRAARAAPPTVTIVDTAPKEDDGRWKLKMTINYGSTPHLAHIPMIFEFTPTVLYERALTDKSGDKPVLVRLPLSNQQAINESMDVGFSDGSGKVFTTTKFDFVLRRDRGFEAGEYDLKIRRSGDGVQMGRTQRVKLQGDNPIIDRRAIVFSGEKKPKKEAPAEEKKESAEDASADPEPGGSADEAPDGTFDGDGAPPPVPPKQGGCGCRLAQEGAASLHPSLAALALGALALRRRRRASPPPLR